MFFLQRFIVVLGLVLCSSITEAGVNSELYANYQRLLSDYVIEKPLSGNGLVSAFNYKVALADENLEQITTAQHEALKAFDPQKLDGSEEAVAFWINAYNFFMLSQVLTDRPSGELVSSVWDYGGRLNPFVDSVFERKIFNIGGRSYSLNEIEKEILLGEQFAAKGWKDARVHFAVNCASVGCPPLRDVIYTADNLENLLAENTRRAFATDRHLRIVGNTLHVTELFKWYEEDFAAASGSRKAFIAEWVDSSVADRVAAASEMKFIDYDWALNKPSNFPEFR